MIYLRLKLLHLFSLYCFGILIQFLYIRLQRIIHMSTTPPCYVL